MWDDDSVMHAEYVGVTLYIQLRNRLIDTHVPASAQNLLILCLIDSYDAEATHNGHACVTLCAHGLQSDQVTRMRIVGVDTIAEKFAGM